jgi:hypothetical protein
VGIALVADDLVLIIGDQWVNAAKPLMVLAVFSAYESILQLPGRVLLVTRETRFNMYDAVALAVVMPISFLVGSRWGPTGIAASWLLVYPVTRIPMLRLTCMKLDLRYSTYFAAFWPALSCTLIMSAGVLGTDRLTSQWSAAPRLLLQIAVGGAFYCLSLAAIHRPLLYRTFRSISNLRAQSSAVAQ